ncbi:hypothetical protein Bbelb_018270 [Branchiostoma belcheri]|nr:hypothetical protein Bbelb_018270 [Branchiostoma belcheri]
MYNPTLNRKGGYGSIFPALGIWHSQPRGQTTLKLLSSYTYLGPVRTNSDVEGWYRRLNQKAHFLMVGKGLLRRHQRNKYVNLHGRIFKAWAEFESGRYTAKNGRPKRHEYKSKERLKFLTLEDSVSDSEDLTSDGSGEDEKDLTAMVGYTHKVRHPVTTGRGRQKLQETLQYRATRKLRLDRLGRLSGGRIQFPFFQKHEGNRHL